MSLTFPGKTFLLGEYAVLKGAPALLLGHGPHFECRYEAGAGGSTFHSDSPAGLWLKDHPYPGRIVFRDPHEGRGGFGGSGAEFLSAWAAEETIPGDGAPRAIFAWSAWEDSRAFPGSGADILVQAFGVNRSDPFFLQVDIPGRRLTEVFPSRRAGELSLFHTGRKLATHEQTQPASLPLAELEAMVLKASDCLESNHFDGFAKELATYGETLGRLGLLAEHSRASLEKLRGLQGVRAAKGCGAMGSDVLLVAHYPGTTLDAWAKENSLAHVGTFPV